MYWDVVESFIIEKMSEYRMRFPANGISVSGLFSYRTVATSHTVFDSPPNTITLSIYSYLQLFKSTVSSVTA